VVIGPGFNGRIFFCFYGLCSRAHFIVLCGPQGYKSRIYGGPDEERDTANEKIGRLSAAAASKQVMKQT
jgi:hypothetical protein